MPVRRSDPYKRKLYNTARRDLIKMIDEKDFYSSSKVKTYVMRRLSYELGMESEVIVKSIYGGYYNTFDVKVVLDYNTYHGVYDPTNKEVYEHIFQTLEGLDEFLKKAIVETELRRL